MSEASVQNTQSLHVWAALCLFLLTLYLFYSTSAHATIQRALSESDLCSRADVVVIAKVIARKSFHDPDAYNLMVTEARFEVEAVAHGDVGPEFDIIVLGGRIGTERAIVGGSPWVTLGARFLLFLSSRTANGDGKYVLIRWAQIDASIDLPSEEEMKAIWSEHCTYNIIDPTSKPTEQYYALLPAWFLDWCSHYGPQPSLLPTTTAPQVTPGLK